MGVPSSQLRRSSHNRASPHVIFYCMLWTIVVHSFSSFYSSVQGFEIFLPHHHSYRPHSQSRHPSSSSFLSLSSDNLIERLDQTFDYPGRIRLPEKAAVDDYRCGFVSFLGAPNMGKSTILNALLQENLCIATSKPQTTRHAILGLLTTNTTQVCLIDTPGVLEQLDNSPKQKQKKKQTQQAAAAASPYPTLHHSSMMEAVSSALKDANVVLVVTDVFSTPIPNDALFQAVQQETMWKEEPPVIIVCINKIDLVDKVRKEDNSKKTVSVEHAVAVWRHLLPQALAILPMTASDGPSDPGIVALRHFLTHDYANLPQALRNLGRPIPGMFRDGENLYNSPTIPPLLPKSPPLYDPEVLTDRPERFIASEIIRAACFELLKKELPYCCEVQIESFKEQQRRAMQQQQQQQQQEQPLIRIKASIIVERDSQKIIVIGKGGQQVKAIGSLARNKLEEFFQTQVYLNLNVKVNKDWRKSKQRLKEYGYLH